MLLPNGIGVGTGCVIDTFHNTSKQTDIIIFEQNFCPSFCINETPEATYYPCEGVISTGELKSSLGSREMEDALEKIKSQKACMRYNPNPLLWRQYNSPTIIHGADSESFDQLSKEYHQIFSFILCNKFSISIDTLLDKLTSKLKEDAYSMPNCIISLNDGITFYMNQDSNKVCNTPISATGVAFSSNENRTMQFLVNKIYTYIQNGITKKIPYEKYILSSTTVTLDNFKYRPFT